MLYMVPSHSRLQMCCSEPDPINIARYQIGLDTPKASFRYDVDKFLIPELSGGRTPHYEATNLFNRAETFFLGLDDPCRLCEWATQAPLGELRRSRESAPLHAF